MKILYTVLFFVCTIFFACKKPSKNPPSQFASVTNVFPIGPNNYWKAYYHVPFGGQGSTELEWCVDSFFVSTDTVGLFTISNSNNILDTNWKVYNIIKAKRTRKYFLNDSIYIETIQNFGIVRIDTTLLRVYTVVPICTCWHMPAMIPNYGYFNEILLFDYNIQSNNNAIIYAQGMLQNTTVIVDSFFHNGNVIKTQYFFDLLNPSDTVASRTQYGSLLNTEKYISEVIGNNIQVPNAILDSMFFFYNNYDSVLIRADTYIIP